MSAPGGKPIIKERTNLKTDKFEIYAKADKHKIVSFRVHIPGKPEQLFVVERGKDGITNAFKKAETVCENYLRSLIPKKVVKPLKRLR